MAAEDPVSVSSSNNTELKENNVNNDSKKMKKDAYKTEKKNQKKKDKKKQKKKQKQLEAKIKQEKVDGPAESEQVEVEYVVSNPLEQLDPNDPAYAEFAEIFQAFVKAPEEEPQVVQEEKKEEEAPRETEEEEKKELSKKQKKKMKRLSIAVLKSLVRRPDLVEAWDVTSHDPLLLVFLKGYRNTVPVPRHWNQKRKYLQGKRGIEKPPFQLPEFIAATGISKIRASIAEKEENQKSRTKQRERLQPKLGKMDIDYQVLHDAFFKYQTKPKLTIHGDLYFEGKEFEITLKEKRPGQLSDELKRALGMPEGAPPPWLVNMQRYGPPPSYPKLKIPGLNAPIPEGARYGFHPGGWGKPPVDEFGRPLYGDVFGTAPPPAPPEISQPIDKTHWGELQDEEEVEEEEEMEVAEEEEEPPHPSGFETPSGLATPSGMETPESLELRKQPAKPKEPSASQKAPAEEESGKQLYQVLQQEEKSVGASIYGSSHKYIIPSEKKETKAKNTVDLLKSQATEKLDVSLNPSEVENLEELNEKVLLEKLESAMKERQQPKEDVSDLVAEHMKKKRKKEEKGKDHKKEKKYKDFKF